MAERRENGSSGDAPGVWREAFQALRGERERFGWGDPIVLILVYLLAVSALFIAFPALDLAISRPFFSNGGFAATHVETLIRLRKLGDQLILLVLLVLAASMVAKLLWPDRPIAIRPRSGLFLIVTLAIGPGLVVNGLFKSFSGRPRPVAVDVFGGPSPFVPAWHFSDYCHSNCSFISGEASSAMWLMGLVFLAPRAVRPILAVPVGAVVAALSLNRIAFGGHFASDVLVAFGFTLLVMIVAYRLIVTSPFGRRFDLAFETALAKAGHRLRDRFRRVAGR